jgi:RimJ/RimL family protein N-acetyltransferase
VNNPQRGRLRGRHLALRPLRTGDIDALYGIICSDDIAFRFRFHGVVPTIEAFANSLSRDVLTQYVIDNGPNNPMGLMVAYAVNPRDQFCYLAGVVSPTLTGSGLGAEALIVFANHLFCTYGLRKIYVEAPDYALGQYRSAIDMGLVTEEAKLVEHTFLDGRWWDQRILALYPETAERAWDLLIARPMAGTAVRESGSITQYGRVLAGSRASKDVQQ